MGESTTDFNAADTAADTVAELVRSLPQFADTNIAVQPIDAGMTNKNFKVFAGDQVFVARMPGRDTELLGIERSSEMVATIRAANLGVGPAVVAELPQMSTLLCEWLQAEVATEQSILEPGALERVAQAISASLSPTFTLSPGTWPSSAVAPALVTAVCQTKSFFKPLAVESLAMPPSVVLVP